MRDALRRAPVPAHAARSRPFARRSAERAVQGSREGGTGWRADGAVLLLEVLHQEERCGQSSGGRESTDRLTQQTRSPRLANARLMFFFNSCVRVVFFLEAFFSCEADHLCGISVSIVCVLEILFLRGEDVRSIYVFATINIKYMFAKLTAGLSHTL